MRSGIVLDAGALIALERNDLGMWAALKDARRTSVPIVTPSTVLAQVWRGSARQAHLGAALRRFSVAPFDTMARKVGELCGRTRTNDICDAHVALVAVAAAHVVYTSDPEDIERLLDACGPYEITIVRV